MNDYLLTIRIPLNSYDDIEARQKAKVILEACKIDTKNVKLQSLEKGKEPRKVNLD